jgi:serine protease Do
MLDSRTRLGLSFLVVAFVGILLGFAVSARLHLAGEAYAGADPTPAAAPAPAPAPTPAAPGIDLGKAGGVSFVELARTAGPAVVNIQVEVAGRFGRGQGQGTGFFISPDGYILTNDHVVGEAVNIQVALADGREFAGRLIGTDARTDIALIKVEPKDKQTFPTLDLGDSDAVQVGEWVLAIGNPFGLDHTVTAGIISAKGRRDVRPGGRRDGYFDFLQTDASINPGNSGGPLIDTRGQVIGINSAVNAQGQGLGFAIPINMAKSLLPGLKKEGRVARSWLGVQIQPVTSELADALKLPDTNGALVKEITPDSPADHAGLAPGDVIFKFDGKDIRRSDDLPWLASTAGIGRTVTVNVRNRKGEQELKVTLEEMPDERRLAQRGHVETTLGVEVATVTPQIARRYGLDQAAGAIVTAVTRDSAAAGFLAPGDIVLVVGDNQIANAEGFAAATKELRAGERTKLLIVRDGEPLWLAVTLPRTR